MIIGWLLSEAWPIIIGLLALAGGLWFNKSSKDAGRREVEEVLQKEAVDSLRKSNENREAVARMDDNDKLAEFDRLRDIRREKERR